MSVVGQLYQLQLADSEWDTRSQRLAEVEQTLGPAEDVLRAQEAVGEVQEAIQHAKARLRVLELEAGKLDAKLKANQDRLYGGKVGSPKELSNLQDEATSLRRSQSTVEDEELELMIAVEAQDAELAERQARLRQIEATWREDQAALLEEKEQLQARLVELEVLREALRERIGNADLALYDDLRRGLGGTAVAFLKRGICQSCGVDVPTGEARAVERGESPFFCPVCSRLLYGGK